MTLIFASNNKNKLIEINNLLKNEYTITGLKDAGINIDIPEPHDTLEANATEKSTVIHALTGQNCFSEDSGLEVDALDGEPGVKSARYANNETQFSGNIDKLLYKMAGQTNRKARFRTIISLIWNGEETQFEGICEGRITGNPSGEQGFGYDPVFIPDGANRTFAEMTLDEKQEFSHRRKAVEKLVLYLTNQTVKKA